uniref:Uncharacterized protein n=1 Tax=Branchiostoma floridae TaxID=7739 RepID=C3XZN9_BRAFL|eukprot:XP_002610427.1 hypothetical protein BRAFLDRAFT_85565 [Branchiostoma floridae]
MSTSISEQQSVLDLLDIDEDVRYMESSDTCFPNNGPLLPRHGSSMGYQQHHGYVTTGSISYRRDSAAQKNTPWSLPVTSLYGGVKERKKNLTDSCVCNFIDESLGDLDWYLMGKYLIPCEICRNTLQRVCDYGKESGDCKEIGDLENIKTWSNLQYQDNTTDSYESSDIESCDSECSCTMSSCTWESSTCSGYSGWEENQSNVFTITECSLCSSNFTASVPSMDPGVSPVNLPVTDASAVTLPVTDALPVTLPVTDASPVTLPVTDASPVTLPVTDASPVTLPVTVTSPIERVATWIQEHEKYINVRPRAGLSEVLASLSERFKRRWMMPRCCVH